jgi:hypothetical protein
MCSSYVTTYFMNSLEDYSSYGSSYYIFISPIDVGHDLIRAALRILRDQDAFPLDDSAPRLTRNNPAPLPSSPSFLKRFVRRFIIGLPMVGAGSVVHMLLSLPLLGPVHWIARFRGNRSRRGNSTDIAAVIILVLLVIGIARQVFLTHIVCLLDHCIQGVICGVQVDAKDQRTFTFVCGRCHSRSQLIGAMKVVGFV